MLLNEHQSKHLFAEAGIPAPPGVLLRPGDLEGFTPPWPGPWYVKGQVLAGGRGKAGVVLRAEADEDIGPVARAIFAKTVEDKRVPLVRVEPAARVAREFYLSFAVSRERGCLVLTVARQGGMDVEALAGDPDALLILPLSASEGLAPRHVRAAFFHLGADQAAWPAFQQLLENLHASVVRYGLLLAEVNPLVLTEEGSWLALDGKVEIDANLAGRQTDLERFYSPEHASREENEARTAGLAFHSLTGWVGLAANGAGLAMATMDHLNLNGLPAANFMDLGGGADLERMRTALTLLFRDPAVKAVFLNVFGGVLSCAKVAQALEVALDNRPPQKPLVVRFAGNEAEEGLAVLRTLPAENLHIAADMRQAMDHLRRLAGPGAPSRREGAAIPAGASARLAALPRAESGLPFVAGMPVLVQGVTGRVAQLHTRLMLEYGTRVAAGVTPFKGGSQVLGVPVYNSVDKALREHQVAASIIFVPAAFAPDAILEAAENGIPWIVCISDGLTQLDMLKVRERLAGRPSRLVGPNTPGLIAPGRTKIGIMPGAPFTRGPVAIVSRSGTLTYETAHRLSAAGIGQSLALGIGGDPFGGVGYVEVFELLAADPETRAVVVLGEIGGNAEESLADWVRDTGFPKPVTAFISGRTAPPGKRLGHAGAIIEPGRGVAGKIAHLKGAGFSLAQSLSDLPGLAARMLVGE
ncbi:MAG: ATP-grasp domain-containing protein [Thermodesulfobacteriota bacterium]